MAKMMCQLTQGFSMNAETYVKMQMALLSLYLSLKQTDGHKDVMRPCDRLSRKMKKRSSCYIFLFFSRTIHLRLECIQLTLDLCHNFVITSQLQLIAEVLYCLRWIACFTIGDCRAHLSGNL